MELYAAGNIECVISNLKVIKSRLDDEKDNPGALLCAKSLKDNIQLLEYVVKKYGEERSFLYD